MNTLSVVIITFNEEQKIAQCLDSVKDIADEIIIVDSHSTDATEAICDRYDVKFFTQDWLGYSDQKNLADELATCDLIFSIDADEALSDELKQSIKTLKDKEIAENEVFAMNRLNNYCGQWVKGCGLYPETKIRRRKPCCMVTCSIIRGTRPRPSASSSSISPNWARSRTMNEAKRQAFCLGFSARASISSAPIL